MSTYDSEFHINLQNVYINTHSTLLLTVKKSWNYLHYWLVGEETKKVVHTCHGICGICGTEGSADMCKKLIFIASKSCFMKNYKQKFT